MMTSRFVAGASLFAMLIVSMCCLPVKQGSYPGAYYGGSKPNTAPNVGLYQQGPSGQFSPEAVEYYNVPAEGIYESPYQAVPQQKPSVPRLTAQRQPEPAVGPGSFGPVNSGYRGTSARQNPDNSAQPEAVYQPALREVKWAVEPPRMLSGGEEVSTGTRAVFSSQPENVSPPGSFYQAGELSTYSQILEQGNSEQETEDLVPPLGPSQPPPHRSESAGQGYARPSLTSEPRPEANTGGVEVPYRFYDFFFLNGQYPPGTVSFSSDSYEQGRDSFQDVHYVRDHFPNNPAPVQGSQAAAAAAPVQNFYAPRIPVKSPLMAGSGRDGAKAASRRGFRQPIRNQAPGYNFGYGGY
ncbi:uncharacterized protein LOC117489301 [Trematomus bernacchii]|uniref:uncharacterized protein LOC117489301 n=1 Tax=Trematomus bernacchii TaxID=40690 RepID=UPI00146D9243|nr:uncharacterized protein LOC117489301 [Trematomus bernacchii]